MEDSLYEVESMRRFAGLKLSKTIPDESKVLNFRHFLEKHELGHVIFSEINAHLQEQGLRFSKGSIVDASIITAPTSIKKKAKARALKCIRPKKAINGTLV